MRCERALRWFSRDRDGELSRWQSRRLAEHLKVCATCREEYRRLEESCGLLRQADPAAGSELPPGLADAVVARMRREAPATATNSWRARVDARVALGIAATLAMLLWGDRLHMLGELPDSGMAHIGQMEH